MANLFQVSQPVFGLMGRRPQQQQGLLDPMLANLLGQVQNLPEPAMIMADEADERMAQADQQRQIIEAPPVREPSRRPSILNALGRSLAPNTAAAYDAERARILAEDNAPRQQAIAAENERIARAIGPDALLALRTNPGAVGESLGMRYRPVNTAAGSITSYGPNAESRIAAPVVERVDDRFGIVDPLNPDAGVRYTDPRGPTFAETTDRFKTENPVLAANSTWLGPDGSVRGQGYIAPEVVSTPQGGTTNVFDAEGRVINSVQGNPETRAPRVVPDAVRRDNEKDQADIDARKATIDRVANAVALIDNGTINLDPASRASAWVRNNTGNSTPQSQAQAELRRTVETLRNNILNDAAGPQTDGDSLRALNQIIQGWGDETVVRQGLNAYLEIQRAKTASQQSILDNRLAQYGDTSAGYGGDSGGNIPSPTSAAQYQALPSGTQYRAPDGSIRRKP